MGGCAYDALLDQFCQLCSLGGRCINPSSHNPFDRKKIKVSKNFIGIRETLPAIPIYDLV